MGPLGWASGHFGLVVLSVLAALLVGYLAWVMVHPERF